MTAPALVHPFKAAEYNGVWLPFDNDRPAFRARVESWLRAELDDPSGSLTVGEDGPRWSGANAVEISYSHSRDRGLAIYSRTHRVGVDIEHESRTFSRPNQEIAKRFFEASEAKTVRDPKSFLDLWCKKEALAKLTRQGLQSTLHQPIEAMITNRRLQSVPVAPLGWIAVAVTERIN